MLRCIGGVKQIRFGRDRGFRFTPSLPARFGSGTRVWAAMWTLLLVTGLFAAASGAQGIASRRQSEMQSPTHRAPKRPPSIVLILTDDQRWDTISVMPTVVRRLREIGVKFSNGFVVNPLCCPSRASLLTGQYSHSTGVYRNDPPHGGFPAFRDRSTIATRLHGAGYRTGLFGKYLNNYPGDYIPPGWDRWAAFSVPNRSNGAYFGYSLNVDGAQRSFGTNADDYSTDVLARMAESFIENTRRPLFLYFAPYAPHPTGPLTGATPAPRHSGAFPDLKPYRPPSYNEADVSDKPAWVQALPRLTPSSGDDIDRLRQSQLRALLAVDDAVDRILDALAATGRLRNSMIVFLSDNGYMWGEHRLKGKGVPYEESIRVPFIVRYDPLVTRARRDGHLAVNIDLAPTFARLAGISAPWAEGRSLLPLLGSRDVRWRKRFLVEQAAGPILTYCTVRSRTFSYIAYRSGEEELYALKKDPYQLDNVARDRAYEPMLRRLRGKLRKLCDPPPPGFTPP